MPPRKAQASKPKRTRTRSPTPSSSPNDSSPDASPPQSPTRAKRPNHFQNITLNKRNATQINRYERLKNQDFKNPRHLDIPTLTKLGLLEDVKTLTERIRIWELLQRLSETPTYIRPAFEFLSSVVIDNDDNIIFRLFGEYRGLTVENLNNLLNTPIQGIRESPSMDQFWFEISGQRRTKTNKNLKSMKIQHPALRYIQRLLANTIFPRGESAVSAKVDELFFLSVMLSPQPMQLDIGYFIIKHAIELAQGLKENAKSGYIVFGAIVTIIAEGLNINLSREQLHNGPTRLDIETLKTYGHIEKAAWIRGQQFNHLLANKKAMRFPIHRVDIHDKTTWILQKPGPQSRGAVSHETNNEEEQEQEPQQSPPHAQAGPSTSSSMDSHAEVLAYLERLDTRLGRMEEKIDMNMWMNRRTYNYALQQGMPYEEPPHDIFGDGFFGHYTPPPPPPPDAL